MNRFELLNKAISYTQNGNFDEAERIYFDLLKEDSTNDIILSAFGLFYVAKKDFDRASYYLKKACEVKESIGTISALGFAEFERADFRSSAEYLEKAVLLGNDINVYDKLVISLFEIKNYSKAIEYADKMYSLYPNDPRAVANQVKALTQSGKLLEAHELCVNYLKEHEENSLLWFHLGFLKELIYSDDKQARECYKIAAELGNLSADYNIAVSCQKMGEFSKAEKYYKKMLEKFPDDKDTKTSLGMCYLTQKKFPKGYELFFQRGLTPLIKKDQRLWTPTQPLKEEVNVICDQGFGDHLQFIRYIPILKQNGVEKINVAVHSSLKDLFSYNYSDINFIDYEDVDETIQAIRITDIAYVLDMDFDNIPFANGYLNYKKALIDSSKIKVGLCWEAGSAAIRTMINRTINIKCLEPIINLDNIQLYSFQVNDTFSACEKYPQMIDLAKGFNSFADTASALLAMDYLITVDTSVAHLAGALGVKTFLLLPYAADWRWFNSYKKTPWYDSVEIFRQIDHISWEEPINDIVKRLKEIKK